MTRRMAAILVFFTGLVAGSTSACAMEPLRAGMAETDITPPLGFPMAGYYHERLATGVRDPLKAKAVVLEQGGTKVAIVACDLTGISTDLTHEVRKIAAEKTGIAAEHIILTATHSHTAPDYTRDLYLHLDEQHAAEDARYAPQLIEGIAAAIAQAHQQLAPAGVRSGTATQETPIAFNRRFVMKDGSVRTWMSLDNPEVVRPAGPIDPEVGIVAFSDAAGQPLGVFSSFALHLDTVGGTLWSADYPYYVERTLREKLGEQIISLFGAGCCGDINHVDPSRKERNPTEMIGRSLGETVEGGLANLVTVEQPVLAVRRASVMLPLRDVTDEQITRAAQLLPAAAAGEKIEFFDLVEAHRSIVLDQFRNKPPRADSKKYISWGLSHQLAGIGAELPVEVHAVAIGRDVAIVFLPGEIFVELGLAIKQASPFNTTLVVELSNAVETVYVPTRAAYAVGSYEVTNTMLEPGSGEILVETALSLLRDSASTSL